MTGTEHILLALLREGENVGLRLLNTVGINIQKLYMDTLIAMGEDISQHKEDLRKRNAKKAGGATSTLNQYSRDLTALAREGKLDPVIGRDTEIMRVCLLYTSCTLSTEQQKLSSEYTGASSDIVYQYINGEERSFTIIAFPVPEIGEKFEEIFDETVKINTLDYHTYERIQAIIIDTLNRC